MKIVCECGRIAHLPAFPAGKAEYAIVERDGKLYEERIYPPAGRSADITENMLEKSGDYPVPGGWKTREGYMAHMGYDRPPLEGDWDEDFRKPGFTGDLSDAQMGELHDLPECDYVVVDGTIHELDAWLEYNGYKAPPRNHGKEAE